MRRLLLLEDDGALGRGICLALKSGDVDITLCNTLALGRKALARDAFDLLILDINLPDGSGLDFLREFRLSGSAIPVILLTANDMETDIVGGLESGADDYITKPFSLAVLRARVNAQLRRNAAAPSGALEMDGFSFDFDRMEFLARLSASPSSPLRYESKATHRAHFREYQMTFAILGGLLCAIIGIVGILNFFNAVMTSILSRRREFAVLQAVGQTQRQLKAMLVWEGLLYTLGSGLISGLLSAAVNPLAGRLLENAYWFYSYRYTITPVLLIVPVFALLGYAIPAVIYRQAAKQSVVERLREADS